MSILVDAARQAHTLPGPWHTLADVIVKHKAHRWHWFDRDESTRRLVEHRIHGGRLFVASEREDGVERRLWSVMVAADDGHISDLFLGAFDTPDNAHLAAYLAVVAAGRVT
jgi:hypothetical protein